MRRESLWSQAQAEIQNVLGGLGPNDHVAFFSFDDQMQVVVGFDANTQEPSTHIQLIHDQLPQIQPGWRATDLGHALVEVIDKLRTATADTTAGEQSIVLISDLQQGARMDALAASTWPPDVRLDVRRLRAPEGNATLHWLPADEADEPSQLRVRVSNDELAQNDRLELVWETDSGQRDPTPAKAVQVPPGRSRVVTVSRCAGATRLRLLGDAHPFDNIAYLAEVAPVEKRLLFVGDVRDEKDRQLYFLKRAELGSAEFPVRVESHTGPDLPPLIEPIDTPLIVLAKATPSEWTDTLRAYTSAGGRVLVVLDPAEYVAERDVAAPLGCALGVGNARSGSSASGWLRDALANRFSQSAIRDFC